MSMDYYEEPWLPEATFVALREGAFRFETLEEAEERRNEILSKIKGEEQVEEIEKLDENEYVFDAILWDSVETGYSDDEYDRDLNALYDLEQYGDYCDMETLEVLDSYWK